MHQRQTNRQTNKRTDTKLVALLWHYSALWTEIQTLLCYDALPTLVGYRQTHIAGSFTATSGQTDKR